MRRSTGSEAQRSRIKAVPGIPRDVALREPVRMSVRPETPRFFRLFAVGYVVLLALGLSYFQWIRLGTPPGWLQTLLVAPPFYLCLEWAVGKFLEPWGEGTPFRKAAKAGCLVTGYLALMALWLIFGP